MTNEKEYLEVIDLSDVKQLNILTKEKIGLLENEAISCTLVSTKGVSRICKLVPINTLSSVLGYQVSH